MRCGLSSGFFRSTSASSVLALLLLSAGCSSGQLFSLQPHVVATRQKTDPGCSPRGIVSLREITAVEMSPLVPMTSVTLEEIARAAHSAGADYVVVRPGPLGPEGKLFRCGISS